MNTESKGLPAKAPPSKDCPKARSYIEHPPHQWHREGKELWQYHCDGILPLDEQPPCQIYISPERPECSEPAPTTIHVKTKLIDALIDVCKNHKSEYDNRATALRVQRGRESGQHLQAS